nr:hypothetical protein [Nostoc sp. ZfuVER08]
MTQTRNKSIVRIKTNNPLRPLKIMSLVRLVLELAPGFIFMNLLRQALTNIPPNN